MFLDVFLAEMQKGLLFIYLTIVAVMLERLDSPLYQSGLISLQTNQAEAIIHASCQSHPEV
jgi:hypothetical protein